MGAAPPTPLAQDRCRVEVSVLHDVTGPGHAVACHLVDPVPGAPRIEQAGAGAA